MLKETFSMRKIGKHLVNVSMLGLAVAPIAGSALAPVTVLAAEQTESKVEKIPFKTETREDPALPKGEKKVIQKGVEGEKEYVTSTPSESQSTRKPVDVIVPYDVSGSTYGGTSELDHLEAVAKQGADDTRYLIIGYDEGNTPDGFALRKVVKGATDSETKTSGAKISKVTRFLSKQEVLTFVKKVRELLPASHQDGSWSWDKAMKALKYYDPQYMEEDGTSKDLGTPYEEIFEKGRDKNKAVGILWFTDDWEGWKKYDNSFFDWAQKNHADQFLTVVYGGTNSLSYNTLTKAGQKAILTTAGKDQTALANEIAEKSTKLVTITTPGKPTTSEKVIKEPVNEIIAIGTKEAEPVKPAEPTKRTEEIPFKTETKEDPTLPEGEKKVVQKGEKGLREFTTTPDVMGNVTGKVEFDIKAGTSTSKESTRKPVDLLAIIDTSGSMVNNFGRALDSTLALVKSLNDDDQITFAHYGFNFVDTYNTGISKDDKSYRGAMTAPMSKKEAIAYLEKAKQFKVTPAGVRLGEFIADMKKQGVKFREDDDKNYQDIYMEHHKKDSTISVIQFTDGWLNTEDIDTDFAAWATKNAKTFMTVSYKNDSGANGGPTDQSVRKMTEAGHKNIYDERKEAIDNNKIIKQFESTATEKVTVTKQDVNIDVTLTIPKDAKLESAELVTPNGPVKMDIKDNVAVYSGEKVADGHYSLTYTVSGGNGDVKVVVNKDGKELVSKSNKLTTTKGSSTDKIIKQPVNEIIHIGTKGGKSDVTEKKVPFETIKKDDPTLEEGQEKVVQEGVEGLIKVTTTYETQKGQKVDGSEKVTEEKVTEKVDKIIAVGTKGSKSEVTEKKVPFETIYKQDATLKKGEEKVLQEGVEGLIKVTTTYETQKGQKVDGSEKVTEQIVTEKVDKIVAQGTMEKRKIRYRVVDSKGQELVKQTDVMEAYQDEEYKVETPKLDGYRLELAKDSVPATGKVADRDVLVTFVAVKIGKSVTLKFVDESGTEIAQKKVLTGEKVDVDTEFSGEAPATIEKDGVKYAFVGIKQTGSKERKVSGKVTDKEQVIEAVYSKPKELPKTNEQSKQRNTVIVALLSVVGLGGLVTYLGLRKRDEK